MTRRTSLRAAPTAALLFGAMLVGVVEVAHANDPHAVVTATALVDAGQELMRQERYPEACPKFREAARLAPPGLAALSQLAECHEKAGRPARAWSVWREVAAATEVSGQTMRHRYATEQVARLHAVLPRLTIELSAEVPGLAVVRDGEPVGPPLIGVPVPVDPGRHHVQASAPGHRSWETSLEVAGPGDVTVRVPRLDPAPATAPRPGVEAGPGAEVEPGGHPGEGDGPGVGSGSGAVEAPRPGPAGDTRAASASRGRDEGWVIAAVLGGAAGVAVAAVGAGLHVAATRDLGTCPAARCASEADRGVYERGQAEERVAFALYGVGAAALATGVVVYLVAPAAAAGHGVALSISPAGLGVQGAW